MKPADLDPVARRAGSIAQPVDTFVKGAIARANSPQELRRVPNVDGTEWLLTWADRGTGATPPPNVLAAADVIAAEIVDLYGTMVEQNDAPCSPRTNPYPNWGFVLRDPDCVLEIFLSDSLGVIPNADCPLACADTYTEHAVISVTANMLPQVRAQGFYLHPDADERAVFRSIIGHELFHVVQGAGVRHGHAAHVEGQARWVETLLSGQVATDPTSTWNATKGGRETADDHQLDPSASLCARLYDASLYWGFLAAHNGGMELLRAYLGDAPDDMTGSCDELIARGIDHALAAVDGVHGSHVEALEDFALAVFTRDFRWAGADGVERDFGRHLTPPARVPLATAGRQTVGAWGLAYVDLSGAAAPVTFRVDDPQWAARVLTTQPDGSVRTRRATAGEPVAIEPGVDTTLSLVRTGPTPGAYQVTLT